MSCAIKLKDGMNFVYNLIDISLNKSAICFWSKHKNQSCMKYII